MSKPQRNEEEPRKQAAGESDGIAGAAVAILRDLAKGILGFVRALVSRGGDAAGNAGPGLSRLAASGTQVSAAVTPRRVLFGTALGCCLLLALSQFADYKSVSVSTDVYDLVGSAAAAPAIGREGLGDSHGYLMVPVALIGAAALSLAFFRGRWQLCRLAVLAGAFVIAFSLLVDRPSGLDEGDAIESYAGVEAQLLGGFWIQLFAGAGLAASAALLAADLRKGRTAQPRKPRPKPAKKSATAAAGGSGA